MTAGPAMPPVTGAGPTATYDREADAVYLHLQAAIEPDDVARTVPVSWRGDGPDVLLELDAGGRLLGLEVLHAAGTLPSDLLRHLTAGARD